MKFVGLQEVVWWGGVAANFSLVRGLTGGACRPTLSGAPFSLPEHVCNCLYLRGLVRIYRFGNMLPMAFVFLDEPRVGLIVRAGTYDYAGIDRASDSDPTRRSIFDVGINDSKNTPIV